MKKRMKKRLAGIITAGVIAGTLTACAAAGKQSGTVETQQLAEGVQAEQGMEADQGMEAGQGALPGESGQTEQEDTMRAEYHKISAEDAKKRMDSGDDIIILDVRTQAEYDESHIPGAILIPNETIGNGKPEQLPDTDKEILVYCRSGNRSAQAAKKLVEAGYTQIYEFGGIMDRPYDTVSGEE